MTTDNNYGTLINKFRNSNFRQVIWPIQSHELIKFAPMALLMFLILLSYNIVRSIKDGLIMTKIAPEIISFIKIWVEMPAGILIVFLYSYLCNKMSTEKVFRILVSSFLFLFALFVYYVYPNQVIFHPDPELVSQYTDLYPHLQWFIRLWGQWTFVAFYVLGELWPVVIFSLLFWQLANKITKTEEAKRFYSFFSFFGQSSLLMSGSIIMYFTSKNHILSNYFIDLNDHTEVMIKSLMPVVLLSGILLLFLHFFIEQKIIKNPLHFQPKKKQDKLDLGLIESMKIIVRSKYLWTICILLVSYAVSVNLIEGLWFSKVKNYYHTTEKFVNYQGRVLFWTGVSTMIFSLIGSSIMRYFGWFWGAILTPAIILIAGTIFFTFCLLEDQLYDLLYTITLTTPAAIIVFIGGLQNVLGKGIKYSLFDASKEMLYIPLDDELKTKGKAAVDIIGTKIGKSSGAITQLMIFTIFPHAKYDNIVPFLTIFFVGICAFWIYGVCILNKEYTKLCNQKEERK
jgi:ADP/ATP carrier protein family